MPTRQSHSAIKPLQVKGMLLLLTLLTACSSKSSGNDFAKELETVTSWVATAQMAGEAWINGNVPTVYAKKTLSKVRKRLHSETDTLAHSSTDLRQRSDVSRNIERIESTVGQMSRAVEQKDRNALAKQLQQLSTQQQTLTTLAKTAGGQNE